MRSRTAFKISGQLIFDALIIFTSFVISFFLRGQIGLIDSQGLFSQYSDFMGWYILIVILVKIPMFWLFGVYRRVWKYASLKDMIAILESVTLGSVILAIIFYILSYPISIFSINIDFNFPFFPRGIFIIDYLLTLTLIIVSRFSERFFNELKFGSTAMRKKRVLIVGAGDAGEMIAREMIRQKNSEYLPIGFLDDDYSKIKNKIHGISVLGQISKMESVIKDQSVDEAINIKIPEVVSEIKDKVIMVTGAGGSIGSEICRQIIRFKPEKIILVDHSENNLFLILEELDNKFAFVSTVPIVIDIRNKQALRSVFNKYKPVILFHAAAYKHVPLMQLNPKAAIQNNYLGTKILARLSIEFGVKRFVLLSTDKAVKPQNVMGVSKLLSEQYLQTLSDVKSTRFMIVRFGNVLGSMGSVVPLFKEQIQSGGPVRVTHPNMKRYFMTIPEASQLVIQACIMGKGGEIYVLDMGEPINILDLAKNMIRIYGMEPGKDIEIKYTGPRDGEKMDEELIGENEELISTGFKQIFEAKHNSSINHLKKDEITNILFNIEKEIQIDDYKGLFKDLKKIVPHFDENKMWSRLYE